MTAAAQDVTDLLLGSPVALVGDTGTVPAQPRPLTLPRRFERQLSLPGFGEAAQARLRSATVLVAGIGGLGGTVATYLAAAGIGKLVLVHPGDLEEPDLNRQTLMRPDRIGTSRVECAAATLRAHHTDVEIVALDTVLADPAIPGLVAEADVVVDARHNFPERYLLNRLCVELGAPLVVAAMNATEAFLTTVVPGEPCLRCVFGEGDPEWQPLGFSVLGAVSGTVGCMAAMEVIKVVAGYGTPTVGRLVHFDLLDMSFGKVRTHRDPTCPDCGSPARRPERAR